MYRATQGETIGASLEGIGVASISKTIYLSCYCFINNQDFGYIRTERI